MEEDWKKKEVSDRFLNFFSVVYSFIESYFEVFTLQAKSTQKRRRELRTALVEEKNEE